MDPKRVVEAGYDAVSRIYRTDDAPDDEYGDWLAELTGHLPASADVLDLGCGCGVPVARWLAGHGCAVTGVDLSAVQIERARALVPEARFLHADMGDVRFPAASFDAVVALYSLIHLPLADQRRLFESIRAWLRPGGRFLAIVGAEAWTGTEDDWLGSGASMWWSHEATATYLRWLEEAGLGVLWSRFVPEDDSGHTLVLARASTPASV
jgi:SAM-dependent methyltransferase